MKNEDKAMEICQNMCLCEHCAKLQFCKSNKHARCFHFIKTEKAVLEMAQWKDEQFAKQMTDDERIAFMDEVCKQAIADLNLYELKGELK